MVASAAKSFNLPYHQHDSYWVGVFARAGSIPGLMKQQLQEVGFTPAADDIMAQKTGKDWRSTWDSLYALLGKMNALDGVEVLVVPGTVPQLGRSMLERKSPAAMQTICESYWLGEALLEDRILCYLQPVMSAQDKVFGYESFARVKGSDGKIISGDRIVAASKALGVEYVVDRHLHVQAIRTFISSSFNGFLFVNFFPGFIHRPSVYLEGLTETAKAYGMVSKHVVLDFTKSETPRDIAHLKSVCEYGRSCGYSIALDDIESIASARKLLPEIKPDFVKIDMHLVAKVAEDSARDTIRQIVELAHASGAMAIGEGIETETVFQQLKQLGVDLFQGYYFSAPVPVEAALAASQSA